MNLRTPTTPAEVTDQWLRVAHQIMVDAGIGAIAQVPVVLQAALACMWVRWQLENAGADGHVVELIGQSVIKVTREMGADPWQIAVASMDAFKRNPPPPGAHMSLIVLAQRSEKLNESGEF